MFTPTVIELQSTLEVVCRDPFLDDPGQPLERSAPTARRRAPHAGTIRLGQRAPVDARPRRATPRAGARRADA
jgi:hypothetical protein